MRTVPILRIEVWGSDFRDISSITDIFEQVVPAPLQAGVLPPLRETDQWVVHIPLGRWSTLQRIPVCPLEHPVYNPTTGELL